MPDDDTPKWKGVPNYPHYEVSDHGRVRSLPRVLTIKMRGGIQNRRLPGRLLSDAPRRGKGYPVVLLSDEESNQRAFSVHTLVLSAFAGPRPPGHEGCHIDGNPENNHASNLRWGTAKENSADRIRHGRARNGITTGTLGKGAASPLASLTAEQVREIRASTDLQQVIADRYGVSRVTIYRVKTGKRY